jgi:hypothetical protein
MAVTVYLISMLIATNDGEFGALILVKLEGTLFLIVLISLVWSYFIKRMKDLQRKKTQMILLIVLFLIAMTWFLTQHVMKYT